MTDHDRTSPAEPMEIEALVQRLESGQVREDDVPRLMGHLLRLSKLKGYANKTEEDVSWELYDRLRKRVEHEDGLVNQRLTWLLVVQGFLFAAFSTVLASERGVEPVTKALVLCLLALLGFNISFSTGHSLHAAFVALIELRETWQTHIQGKPYEKQFPQLLGSKNEKRLLFGAAEMVPLYVMVAWICLGLLAYWSMFVTLLPYKLPPKLDLAYIFIALVVCLCIWGGSKVRKAFKNLKTNVEAHRKAEAKTNPETRKTIAPGNADS